MANCVANGWQPSLSIALDNIVSSHRINALMADFYRHVDNVELIVRIEVFNGVWGALATGRADIAIGATTAVPVGGEFSERQEPSVRIGDLAERRPPEGVVAVRGHVLPVEQIRYRRGQQQMRIHPIRSAQAHRRIRR